MQYDSIASSIEVAKTDGEVPEFFSGQRKVTRADLSWRTNPSWADEVSCSYHADGIANVTTPTATNFRQVIR